MCFLGLYERAFRSRLTLREEGQVEVWEWPNGLSAGVILLLMQGRCQQCFLNGHSTAELMGAPEFRANHQRRLCTAAFSSVPAERNQRYL